MKIQNMLLLLLTGVALLIPSVVHCQFEFQDTDFTGTIFPALQNQVRGLYGINFDVYFVVMDSMIGNIPISDQQEAITDPYGTLKGTVFFWAVPDEMDPENGDSIAVGIFKNGTIIWITPPIYRGGGITQIYASLDLNNDGEVDLITLWSPSTINNQSTDIRIFSWNGITGRLISDYDQITQETKLITTNAVLDIIDMDGNGNYRLRAYWSNDNDIKNVFPSDSLATRPWVTYSWNGTNYVLGSSSEQIPGNILLPADRLTVSTRCRVTAQVNGLKYDYVFTSDSSSRQRVQWIFVGGISDSSLMYAPINWETNGERLMSGRVFLTFDFRQQSMIAPGGSMGGFGYESKAIPTIVKYYIQGLRPHAFNEDDNQISDEAYLADIFTNSVSGYTLGTTDTTRTLAPLSFLDTLSSYINQSSTLGWITNQSAAKVYSTLFDSAKAELRRNDNRSTRSTLDTIIQHSVQDSSGALSSEAFALIYFNTQYLLAQLPAISQFTLTVNVNGSGTVSSNPAQSLYDSATTIQLTATPSTGYSFASWSGDAIGSTNPITITMNRNKTVRAVFVAKY